MRCVMLLSVSLSFLLPACSARDGSDGAAARRAYGGHRVLVWAVDKETREARGFAQGTVRPGGELKLTPADGYAVTFSAGQVANATVSDFRREWQEPSVPFTTRHATGSTESSRDLATPFVHVEYGINEPLASVAYIAPVGSLRSERLKPLLAGEFKGDTGELEDLLLAAALDQLLDLQQLTEAYDVLGRTSRREQWARLMDDRNGATALAATTVLARTGDAPAQAAFRRRVLEAKGNAQVELIDILCQMPQSAVFLETIVDLITTPGAYRVQTPPGVAAGDMDRRYGLFRALQEYPNEQVRPYAERLRRWAKKQDEGWRRQVEGVLEAEAKQSNE